MDERQALLTEIRYHLHEIKKFASAYREKPRDIHQQIFYLKLEEMARLERDKSYQEAINRLNVEGLTEYCEMLRGLSSQLAGQRLTVESSSNRTIRNYAAREETPQNSVHAVKSPFKNQSRESNSSLNTRFANIMASFVGIPYVLGGSNRDGIDCSGTIILALSEMGYDVPDATAADMASGNLDWLDNITSDEARAGEPGVLNFYKFGGSTNVSHVNTGVGRAGTPTPLLDPAKQIVDATEGSTMNSREGNIKQYKKPKTGQVNQTYTPYSTNTAPSSQARLNWDILYRKYKRALPEPNQE